MRSACGRSSHSTICGVFFSTSSKPNFRHYFPYYDLRKKGLVSKKTIALLFILGAGSYFDIHRHRIPNWLVAVGIITGALIFALAEGDFYALEAITAFFF